MYAPDLIHVPLAVTLGHHTHAGLDGPHSTQSTSGYVQARSQAISASHVRL